MRDPMLSPTPFCVDVAVHKVKVVFVYYITVLFCSPSPSGGGGGDKKARMGVGAWGGGGGVRDGIILYSCSDDNVCVTKANKNRSLIVILSPVLCCSWKHFFVVILS